MKAGQEFFAELDKRQEYALTQPAEATAQARRLAYRAGYYDRGGTEVLVSIRRGYNESTHNNLFDQRFYSGPTLNYVNMFPWADGEDFPENFHQEYPS